MEVIYTEKAPAAIGPYSQAMKVGGLVFTSGQIPIDPATGNEVIRIVTVKEKDLDDDTPTVAEAYREWLAAQQ